MKLLKKTIFLLLALFLLSEIVCRFVLGLGEVPLYIESGDYEYIYGPDQDVKRFGNRVLTNTLGMRSEQVDTSAVRILGFGDSILNGGSQTDHDSLATTILSKQLSSSLGKKIQLLNISANSWGPDNAYAFLKKHGHFGAKAIVLVFSSHDLYDNMHFQKVVGVHPAWPDKKPSTATTDAVFKYVIPWMRNKFDPSYDEYSYLSIDQKKVVNTGWNDFITYSEANNLMLFVYIHPTLNESMSGSYDSNGKQLIIMLKEKEIPVIAPLTEFNSRVYYRDFIHLNEAGQRKMASIILPYLN